MTGSPSGQSKVDIIYDLLADLPTLDDQGGQLGEFRCALIRALEDPHPSLDNKPPSYHMGLALVITRNPNL
ncbi:hypothetical protein EDB85DRAFT_2143718 [Lactarius pseudohatsudake]|nr:hypothetical protein EDB85DRAFT_2143718 [Lactarius pseudohatsudake]